MTAARPASPFSTRFADFIVEHGCMPPGWSLEGLRDAFHSEGIDPPESVVSWEKALNDFRERVYLPKVPDCARAANGCRDRSSNALLILEGTTRFSLQGAVRNKIGPLVRKEGGRSLYLVGNSSEGPFYLDAQGRLYRVARGVCRELASSPFVWVERQIMKNTVAREKVVTLVIDAPLAKCAAALQVPKYPEASDEQTEYFVDDHFVLSAYQSLATRVDLSALGESTIVRLRKGLSKTSWPIHVATDLSSSTKIIHLPLASAKPLVEPKNVLGPSWTFGGLRGWVSASTEAQGKVSLVASRGRNDKTREVTVARAGIRDERRTLLDESRLSEFSPRAKAFLLARQVRRDPAEIPEGNELAAMLARWGLPSYAALVDANQRWSGFAWGEAATDDAMSRFGTFATLLIRFPYPLEPFSMSAADKDTGYARPWNGRQVTVFGFTGETVMFLDHDGSVLEADPHSGQFFLSAGSPRTRVEFEAAYQDASERGHRHGRALAGSKGAALAAEFKIPPAPEATDHVRKWWIGKDASINELYSPEDGKRQTAVLAKTKKLLDKIMDRGFAMGDESD